MNNHEQQQNHDGGQSELSGLVSCPNCPDQGWYPVELTTAGCCGCPNADGSCCGNAVPVLVQEQEQCEFCWTTPNSVFNANSAANAGNHGPA